MNKTNLLEKYPNLLETVKELGSYEAAIKFLEKEKQRGTLLIY